MAIVYKATNKENGDFYIGVTTKTLKERRAAHFYSAKCKSHSHCKKFCNAIRKYGEDSFIWEILEEFDGIKEACDSEVMLISRHKPHYNIASGGWNPLYGLKRTPEWKEKISKSNKGKHPSIDAIRRSVETKYKRFKNVICLNDKKVFESVKSASRFYNIGDAQLSQVLTKKEMSAHGLYFSFYNEQLADDEIDKLLLEAEDRKVRHNNRLGKSRRKQIICLDNMAVYESAVSAAISLGTSPASIMMVLSGKSIRANGYQFAYYTPDFSSDDRYKIIEKNKIRIAHAKKAGKESGMLAVLCLNDSKIHRSCKDAADFYEIPRMTLWRILHNRYKNPHKSGLRFAFYGAMNEAA